MTNGLPCLSCAIYHYHMTNDYHMTNGLPSAIYHYHMTNGQWLTLSLLCYI